MTQSRNHHNRHRSPRQTRSQLQTELSRAARLVRRRLYGLSPDARRILEVFRLAVESDTAGRDRLSAEALAAAYLLRRRLVEEVLEQGVILEHPRRPIRAHPALRLILAFDKLLGITAKDLGLTRKSRGKDERRDLLAERQRHDAMLRAANKRGLPGPDRELFRKKPS